MMDRWEPPVSRQPTVPRRRSLEGGTARVADRWPEAVESASGRILAAFIFIVATSFPAPDRWLAVSGSGLVVLLYLVSVLVSRWGSAASRTIWLGDAMTLGLVTPLLIVNGFAAVGGRPILPAESAVYLRTAAAALLGLAALAALSYVRHTQSDVGAGIIVLPVALTLVALPTVHDDYRGGTVAGALAIVWLTAAIGTLVARIVEPLPRGLLPLALFSGLAVIGLAQEPGLFSFGDRPSPVSIVQPLLILAVASVLASDPVLVASRRATQRRQGRRAAGRKRRSKR